MKRTPSLLGALAALTLACGAESRPEPEADARAPESPGKVNNDAGIAPATDAARELAPAFSVTVDANKIELCAGECADLTASPRNASGTVSYSWTDGLPAAATQHVCPTSTHTYNVDASFNEVNGEFTSVRKASDGITVSVRDCSVPKADDGVLCELRHRYDYPSSGDVFATSKPWLNLGTYVGGSSVKMTPDGGAWVVGSFGGDLDLGAGRVQAPSPMSTFLHRLDKDCKPVRTIVLRATNASETILPGALAVDAQGNAYVASIAGPLVTFNLLSPSPIRWTSELLIEKFSPSGESLYRYRIGTSIGGMLSDLEVNAAGEAFLAGSAPATTDLGSGLPIGLSFTSFHTFVLKLTADGKFAKQRVDTGAYYLAVGGDRAFNIVNTGKSFDILSVFLGFAPEPPVFGVAGMQQSDLMEQWQSPWADSEYPSTGEGFAAGGLAVIYNRDEQVAENKLRRRVTVRRYGPDGTRARETDFISREVDVTPPSPDAGIEELWTFNPDYMYFSHQSESEPGTLALAGTFTTSVLLAGTQLTAKPTKVDFGNGVYFYTDPGAMVIKLNADDGIRWVRQQDFGEGTYLLGMSSAPSGEVFVAGQARVGTPAMDALDVEFDMVVRKLRAD